MTDPTDDPMQEPMQERMQEHSHRAASAYRQRLGEAPPAVADRAVLTFAEAHAPAPAWSIARAGVLLAGLAGLVIDVPVLIGAATHTSQDVAGLHVALAIGLLIAAWRPARYATGMAPVLSVAAVLLFLPGTSAVATSPMGELSHLPVIIGAASLLLGRWPGQSPRQVEQA